MINSVSHTPIFKTARQGGVKLLDKLEIEHPLLGRLNVATRKDSDGALQFITEIKNVRGKVFGYEAFKFKKEPANSIFGCYIQTEPEYQRRNFGFGEILRLVSIMLMKENNTSVFNIYAKDTAIGFHAKYGFKPGNKIFAHGIDMSLSPQTILENRDFYNALFQKHGIDYCV